MGTLTRGWAVDSCAALCKDYPRHLLVSQGKNPELGLSQQHINQPCNHAEMAGTASGVGGGGGERHRSRKWSTSLKMPERGRCLRMMVEHNSPHLPIGFRVKKKKKERKKKKKKRKKEMRGERKK